MGAFCSNVELDQHPKLMAGICTCVGVAGIGIVICATMVSEGDIYLGIGIALGVAGVAGTILGIIHLQSSSAMMESKKNDDFLGSEKVGANSLAPGKIPSPFEVSKGKVRGVDDDSSPSPTRIPPPTSPEQRATEADLGIGQTRWAALNGGSPARGILPDTAQRAANGNGAVGQNGLIFHETAPALPARGDTHNGSGGGGGNGNLALSPFEKRSFPVPSSLFPTPSPAVTRPLAMPMQARPQQQSFNVDTGVSGGNGYDPRTAQELIRANQDAMDAVRASRMQQQGPVGMDVDDEDALPSDWHQRRY